MNITKLDTAHNQDKKITFYNLCVYYTLLLTAAACVVGSTGSSSLMLIITAMFAPLILKPEMLLCPVLFFSIFDDYLLAGSSASVSRYITIFLIAGTAISILRKGSIKNSTLYFLFLTTFGIVLSFYVTYDKAAFPITYILNMALAITLLNYSIVSAESIAKQFHAFAILALAFLYFMFIKNGFDSLVEGSRMSIAENVNSNDLAMGVAIVMTILVSDTLLFKNHTLLNIPLIGANLVALFLTGSRTALIAAIAAAFLLVVINTKDRRSKRNAFLLLIVGSVLLILIYNTLQKNFPLLMERFTAENVEESGGTGRVDVWKNYFIHFFPKYWLFGMGYGPNNLFYALRSINVEAHGAHNIVVEALSRSGVVGLILYTICFVKFFRATTKNLSKNRFLILPIAIVMTILINGIGENTLGSRFTWFGIGLGYMFIHAAQNEEEKLSGGNYGF